MNLLAQSALRAYAHASVGDQHADHQLRIDRGATGAAVERLHRLTNVIEVEMPTPIIAASPAKSEAVNHGIAAASINRATFSTLGNWAGCSPNVDKIGFSI
jgi:hypothetical protein